MISTVRRLLFQNVVENLTTSVAVVSGYLPYDVTRSRRDRILAFHNRRHLTFGSPNVSQGQVARPTEGENEGEDMGGNMGAPG